MKEFFLMFVPHLLFKGLVQLLFGELKVSVSCGVFQGSLAASSPGTFTTNYLPMFIGFTAATVPTNFQIEISGEPMVFNLDGNGLNAMTHIRHPYRAANTYVFQLADGEIKKNCLFSVTNAVAATLNIFGWSPVKNGSVIYQYGKVPVDAGETVEESDFSYLGFPEAAATDKWQVAYNDSSVDNLVREEVNMILSRTQYDASGKYNIDNVAPARISRVWFTGTAAQTVYKQFYRRAK